MMKFRSNNSKHHLRKNNKPIKIYVLIGLLFILVCILVLFFFNKRDKNDIKGKDIYKWPDFDVDLLTPNKYSRPQTKLKEVKGIVVHYTANPKTTAKQNRDYFNNLSNTHLTSASSHFIIGIDGEAIQCVPLNEIAYASNSRNVDTISIENCHLDKTGKFTSATYNKLVEMCAWLCLKYELSSNDIIRHYDVTKKLCPLYYVEHEDEWIDFKKDVAKKMETYPKNN